MKDEAGSELIRGHRRDIADIRYKTRAAQPDVEPQDVSDYELRIPEGTVRLSTLFGDHEDLMAVHNMGSSRPNCALWADGHNGVRHHVITRTALAAYARVAAPTAISWL